MSVTAAVTSCASAAVAASPSIPPRSFTLNDAFLDKYRDVKPQFGFGLVGELTFRRTYSRKCINDPMRNEEWFDTIRRVVEGAFSILQWHLRGHAIAFDLLKLTKRAEQMFDHFFSMRCTPPGRGLWVCGTDIVHVKGLGAALQNCAFVSTAYIGDGANYNASTNGTSTNGSPADPFAFVMDVSMLGVGTGFDTAGRGKVFVVRPRTINTSSTIGANGTASVFEVVDTHVVVDSREGWVAATAALIDRWLRVPTSGQVPTSDGAPPPPARPLQFDYSKIRVKGQLLNTFGGLASGPKPLIDLHEHIANVLGLCNGLRISSRNIVDLMNGIGVAVIAGNVRRTALIAFGADGDSEFLDLKNYQQNPERAAWGWSSNNSVMADTNTDYAQIAERILNNGEPGLIWLDNMRKYGRLNDTPDYRDYRVMGANPCVEQSLEHLELCNLGETMLNRHVDLGLKIGDFFDSLESIFLYCKIVTLLPTGFAATDAVMQRNRRIGTSVTGVSQFLTAHPLETLRQWLDLGYQHLRDYDRRLSNWLHVPDSIKITSVKPSGCCRSDTMVSTSRGLLRLDEIGDVHGPEWQPITHTTVCNEFNNKTTGAPSVRAATKFYVNAHDIRGRTVGALPVETVKLLFKSGMEFVCTPEHQLRVYDRSSKSLVWKHAGDITIDHSGGCGDAVPHRLGSIDATSIGMCRLAGFGGATNDTNTANDVLDSELAWILGFWMSRAFVCQNDANQYGVNEFVTFHSSAVRESVVETHHDILWRRFARRGDTATSSAFTFQFDSDIVAWLTANNLLFSRDAIRDYGEHRVPLPIRKSPTHVIRAWITGFCNFDIEAADNFESHFSSLRVNNYQMAQHLLALLRYIGVCPNIVKDHNNDEDWIVYFWSPAQVERVKLTRKYNDSNDGNDSNGSGDAEYAEMLLDYVVSKTTSIGETYDIEVPDGNTYIANGFVSHNSVSLLSGSTPGMHWPISRTYVRRVTLDKQSNLIVPLLNAGYTLEQSASSPETSCIVELPVRIAENVRTCAEVSMHEQLALAAFLQRVWADNQVSATITFNPETEGRDIKTALEFYQYSLKGVSFLPLLEHGAFLQMPYESISDDEYFKRASVLRDVIWDAKVLDAGVVVPWAVDSVAAITSSVDADDTETTDASLLFCDGDRCTR